MFNLDSAITSWLRRLSLRDGLTDDDLLEVESHIRDEVESLVEAGLPERKAFFRAIGAFGEDNDLARRYRTASWEKELVERTIRAPLLAGHHVKLAVRGAIRRKGYTSINLIGLSVGIACFILIALFVRDELSFDQFHDDSDRIYRVVVDRTDAQGVETRRILTPGALAEALVQEVPEIVDATRIHRSFWGKVLLSNAQNESYYGDNFLYADDAFFDVFSFPFVRGDAGSALKSPTSIVLTQTLAQRFFGDSEPIGMTLVLNGGRSVRVTGVIEDIPAQSHLRFDFVFPTMGVRPQWATDWTSGQMHTYVVLQRDAPVKQVLGKIQDVKKRHYQGGDEVTYAMQPLTGINGVHLTPTMDEFAPGGSKKDLEVLGLVAIFIVLIAGINYVNLATARSAVRAREMGIRKVVGAKRRTLVNQFLVESILASAAAGVLAVGLLASVLPWFNVLMQKNLALSVVLSPTVMGLIGITVLVFGLGAGLYPAFYLSAFRPSAVLRKQVAIGRRTVDLRRVLVVTQFALSAFLIIGMFVAQRQMDFVRNAKLGFDKDQVLVIRNFDQTPNRDANFVVRRSLEAIPGVVKAGGFLESIIGVRGELSPGVTMKLKGSNRLPIASMTQLVDDGYMEVLGLEWIEGRNFSPEFPSDLSSGVILNETAAKRLGILGAAVGRQIVTHTGAEKTVIGVVKDFHASSLHHEITPFMFHYLPWAAGAVLKLSGGDVQKTLAQIDETWSRFVPEEPMDYSFLDDEVDQLYQSEQNFRTLFSMMSVVALIVACLGLFGLAAFTAERRKKELGIRKTLGATGPNLIALLSKDFLMLVIIANIISWPVAYLAMRKWLENFAYHTSIDAAVFALAGLIAVAVAAGTVSYQALKAVTTNPVESLRLE